MEKRIVDEDILAIIATKNGSKIILDNREIVLNEYPTKIVEKLCLYYGSNLKGRIVGARECLGIGYKCPIIVSENKEKIAIPTSSYKNANCDWIFLDSVLKYYNESNNKLIIVLKNWVKISLELSLITLPDFFKTFI